MNLDEEESDKFKGTDIYECAQIGADPNTNLHPVNLNVVS